MERLVWRTGDDGDAAAFDQNVAPRDLVVLGGSSGGLDLDRTEDREPPADVLGAHLVAAEPDEVSGAWAQAEGDALRELDDDAVSGVRCATHPALADGVAEHADVWMAPERAEYFGLDSVFGHAVWLFGVALAGL